MPLSNEAFLAVAQGVIVQEHALVPETVVAAVDSGEPPQALEESYVE